jgi:hypothetical protein
MTTFTKWFLINAIVLTASFLAEKRGSLSLMINNDASYICIAIMVLYVVVSAFLGWLSFVSDRTTDIQDTKNLLKKTDVGWFCAEHFFSLGLLGTIIGLCIATGANLSDTATTSEVVRGLKIGLNTAFYTTVCGIVFSLPVQVQLMVLKYKLER